MVRQRSRLVKIKPAFTLPLAFAAILTACDRLEDVRIRVDRWRWERRERLFYADMDRIAKDTQGTYQLVYVITDDWLPALMADQPHFRAIQNGKFDMAPWLLENGVEANQLASAVFDPTNRKITIIDTGPNIALIESMIEPFRPDGYQAIKTSALRRR